MNELYKIFPNRDFRDNWGYFNSVFKSEITLNFMRPIESILIEEGPNAEAKLAQINEIIKSFQAKKKELDIWRDEILERFIHKKEQ